MIFSFRIEIILECRIRAHQDTATGVSKIDIILITGMIEIETMTVGFTIKVSNIAQINLQNTKVSLFVFFFLFYAISFELTYLDVF